MAGALSRYSRDRDLLRDEPMGPKIAAVVPHFRIRRRAFSKPLLALGSASMRRFGILGRHGRGIVWVEAHAPGHHICGEASDGRKPVGRRRGISTEVTS